MKYIIKNTSKTKKFVQEALDQLVPEYFGQHGSTEEYKKDLSNYRLYNNELDTKDIKEICNPLGLPESYKFGGLKPFNKTYYYIDVMRGEELKRSDTPHAVSMGEKSKGRRDIELYELYKNSVQQEIDVLLQELMMRSQGANEDEIKQAVDKMTMFLSPDDIEPSEFQSELEILANSIIEYLKFDQDLFSIKNEGFFHLLIAGKEIIKVARDGKNAEPRISVCNPLFTFFDKSSNTKYIQDGNWAAHREMLTAYDVLELYSDELTETQIKRIEEYGLRGATENTGSPSKSMKYDRHKTWHNRNARSLAGYLSTDEVGYEDDYGLYGKSYTASPTMYEERIPVVHFEIKLLRKVGFLTYINEYGDEVTTLVDESYKPPKDATVVNYTNKFDKNVNRYEWYDETGEYMVLEYMNIPEVWESTRVDNDIFVKTRRKKGQEIDLDAPFNVKLSYYGLRLSSSNSRSISVMSRMRPFQFLYLATMYRIGEIINNMVGPIQNIDASQLPLELSESKDPQEIMNKFLYFRSRGIAFYNSVQNTLGGSTAQRGQTGRVEIVSDAATLNSLYQVALGLEQEIGKAAGISPQRAAQFSPSSNVSDNRQAITQSAHMTEHIFNLHSSLWKEVLNGALAEYADYLRDIFSSSSKEDHKLQYVLPDKSIKAVLITPDKVEDLKEAGIFVSTTGDASRYMEDMRNLSLTILQNEQASITEISEILISYTRGSSPEEIDKKLKAYQNNKEKREQAAMKAQQEQEAANREFLREQEELAHARELEKIQLEKELDRQTRVEVEQIKTDKREKTVLDN